MEKLKFDKMFLLQRLGENKKRHESIFDEALAAWNIEARKQLRNRLDDFLAGSDTDLHFNLQKPTNHLTDYNRVLLMIEHSTQVEIELSESEYAQYVMDDWNWQRSFMVSNSLYSGMAASGCTSMGY